MPRAAAVIAALVLSLLVPAAAAAQEAQQQEQDQGPPTLSVMGFGEVEVKPDTASIGIGVRRTGVAREAVRGSVNRRTARIISRARRLGVDRADIQTSGITLDKVSLRPLKKGGPRRIRFVASNSLTIRTQQLRLVGPIFDAATKGGATDFSGPNYSVQDRTPGRADATRAAVRDARRRAEAAATELGRRIVGVRSVVLDPDEFPERTSAGVEQESAAGGEGAAPTPTSPGTETISATVAVVYEMD